MEGVKLGHLIEGSQQHRDAIHIAVAPVVAAEPLQAGDRIGFATEGNTELVGKCEPDKVIGIVDPFLLRGVYTEDRFWMLLLPNTITALRHEWTHVAFGAGSSNAPSDPDKAASIAWIEQFAAENGVSYKRMMQGADDWSECGEYTHQGQNEDYKDVDYSKWPLFWKHYEIVRECKVKDPSNHGFFSCSC